MPRAITAQFGFYCRIIPEERAFFNGSTIEMIDWVG